MTMLSDRPLLALAAALANGDLRAAAIADEVIDRHQRFGSILNAYMEWSDDATRREAQAADLVLAGPGPLGPLHGIPVSVKDHFGVRGFSTYAGTSQRLPPRWETEGPVVSTLRRQLGVIPGKTIAVELAFGGIGLNNYWGTPRNPWDAEQHRVSGGSSSGAGVSLWEGSALVAYGTDTGGSVRVPASMTGTVGLKTTFGRWSLDGIVPLSPTLDTAGILTRSVMDAAYAFAALDPVWDGDVLGFMEHVQGLEAADLRIGSGDMCLWMDCDPGIAEAVQRALAELERDGAQHRDLAMPEAAEAIHLLRTGSVVSAQCDAFLETELVDYRTHLDPIITARIADGGTIPAREYLLRLAQLQQLAANARRYFVDVDVIVCPTIPITPPTLADLTNIDAYRRLNMMSLRNTCVGNFLGLCGLSIPVGLDSNGLPVGMMLLAASEQEERLLAVGLAMERCLGTPRERLGVPPLVKA